MTSDIYKAPPFLSTDISSDNENTFDSSFRPGYSMIEPGKINYPLTSNNETNMFLQNFDDDGNTSLFGFSPRASPPLSAGSQKSPSYWNTNQDQFHPNPFHHQQLISPPMSTDDTLETWPYNQFSQRSTIGPPRIRTQHDPAQTLVQYGQFTPPNDRTSADFGRDDVLPSQPQQQHDGSPEPAQGGKRKRTSAGTKALAKPPKRARKSAGRPKSSSHILASKNSEDDKRSKFLERNRVAASKCRQKKKEWTSNLESRARELQHHKKEIAMIVASLKEEVMFLKGEMLKHTSCGCDRVRNYLNREADNIAQNALHTSQPIQIAASLIGSEPEGDLDDAGGVSSPDNSRRDSNGYGSVAGGQRSPSPLEERFKSEMDFESMLASSLTHDAGRGGDTTHLAGR